MKEVSASFLLTLDKCQTKIETAASFPVPGGTTACLCTSVILETLLPAAFGLVIAYILPGFIALWGLVPVSSDLTVWLGLEGSGPSLASVLYTLPASLGAGMFVSAVRWTVVDRLHHWTGLREPRWDFGQLQRRLSGFNALVEAHYRYYQGCNSPSATQLSCVPGTRAAGTGIVCDVPL